MTIKPPYGFGKFEAPLVHKVCELYLFFHDYLKLFPNYEKYSIGKKIEEIILEILELSLRALYLLKEEKLQYLKKIDIKINLLKTLIRLVNEIKCLDSKKYLSLEEKLQEIGRMTGGWMRSLNN